MIRLIKNFFENARSFLRKNARKFSISNRTSLIVGLCTSSAFTIGSIVPGVGSGVSYSQNPERIIMIATVVAFMFFFWSVGLGHDDLDLGRFCVSDNDSEDESMKNFEGHTGGLHAFVALREEGPLPIVVTASSDRDVKVWGLSDGKLLSTYHGHISEVYSLCVTNSMKIVSGSREGELHVWEGTHVSASSNDQPAEDSPLTCNTALHYRGHNGAILFVTPLPAPSPCVLSCAQDGTIFVWNTDTCSTVMSCDITTLRGASTGLGPASRSPRYWTAAAVVIRLSDINRRNDMIISYGSANGSVCVWTLSRVLIDDSSSTSRDSQSSKKMMVYDPKDIDNSLFLGHFGKISDIHIYEGAAGQKGNTGRRIDSFPDWKPLVISTSTDWSIRVWSIASKLQLYVLEGHSGPVEAVTAMYDESTPILVSAGQDGTVRVWSLRDGTPCGTLEGHKGSVQAIAIICARSQKKRVQPRISASTIIASNSISSSSPFPVCRQIGLRVNSSPAAALLTSSVVAGYPSTPDSAREDGGIMPPPAPETTRHLASRFWFPFISPAAARPPPSQSHPCVHVCSCCDGGLRRTTSGNFSSSVNLKKYELEKEEADVLGINKDATKRKSQLHDLIFSSASAFESEVSKMDSPLSEQSSSYPFLNDRELGKYFEKGRVRPLIVSGDSDANIRVWDLDRLIRDMKWQRRRSLGVFVACCADELQISFLLPHARGARGSKQKRRRRSTTLSSIASTTTSNEKLISSGGYHDIAQVLVARQSSAQTSVLFVDDLCRLIASFL